MTPPASGGGVSQPKRANQRFRRFPSFGPEHDRRVAWGKAMGENGKAVRKRIEEMER